VDIILLSLLKLMSLMERGEEYPSQYRTTRIPDVPYGKHPDITKGKCSKDTNTQTPRLRKIRVRFILHMLSQAAVFLTCVERHVKEMGAI
jgi:hypothetical protein